ncbi:MAG TPA: octaprenyl-diphosphate synthase, partial [Rhodanobacteraceae bacterium]|nr:octaprenyl-diphosphate synthase [Rhodanobacteraceae bacterium]
MSISATRFAVESTHDFASVRQLASSDMAIVDALIRRRLASHVVLINQIAAHIIDGGG